jgi:SulP family sulfate permease
MAVGFLEAVALGLLLAIVLFVVSYSQVNVIHRELDGATFRSRVARTRKEEKVLYDFGDRQYILMLQGFIFFGTANTLLNQMRQRVEDPHRPKPEYILLDFRRVSGLDSTGMLRFQRMRQLAEQADLMLIFTEPKKRVAAQLRQGGFIDGEHNVRILSSLDEGAAWCEDQILATCGIDLEKAASLVENLRELIDAANDEQEKDSRLASLLNYFEKLHLDPGEKLITHGDRPDDLYFIHAGQLTAQLDRPGLPPIRLETSGSGNVIGEIGFYLGMERTADVIADEPTVLYRLSADQLQKLEETDSELAATLHRIIVRLLAERVVKLTHSLRALEE